MNLRKQIEEKYVNAIKSKNADETNALRLIKSAIKDKDIANRTSENNTEINDQQILVLLQSMIKQRKESFTQFEAAGRVELAQKENREIEILSNFLPTQLSKEEINLAISKALNDLNVQSSQDIGKVMGLLNNNLKGKADMSLVSQLVKNELNKSS